MNTALSVLLALLTATACGGGIIHNPQGTDGGGGEVDAEALPGDGSLTVDAADPVVDAAVDEPDAEPVCQPGCVSKTCGDDGCGGSCGDCVVAGEYCDATQNCVPCQTVVCGVCDEIDVTTIVDYSGPIGGDHAIDALRAEVFGWPITTELVIAQNATSTSFSVVHFPGESWQDTSNGYTDGAVMVACWDKVGVGLFCQSWEWWTMEVSGGIRHFDWPADRPVAHMLVSAIDEKRTAIKFFDNWPHNNPPADFNATTVGTGLQRRLCQ